MAPHIDLVILSNTKEDIMVVPDNSHDEEPNYLVSDTEEDAQEEDA